MMKFSGLMLFSVATLVAALAPPIPPGQAAAAAVDVDMGSSPRLNIHSYLKARSKVDPKCNSKQKSDIKKALDMCRKIAKAAAAAARTGDAARLETYFHTSEQAYRNRIAAVYDEIAQECKDGKEGQLTISCDASAAQCPDDPNTVAYYTRGTDTVTLCPAALARPVKPKRCGDRSLAGVLIHEFSHALSANLVVDHRYGRYESTQLTRDQALGNADTYQWFAIDVYLNCPAPTPMSPPTSEPEPVAGPSGLCQQHVSKALEPVRAKFKGQKLPLSEVVAEVQQALCTADPTHQPPANKPKDATRCNEGVSELLQVFDEVGQDELSEYLTSADIVKDMCFEPSVYENMPDFASDEDSPDETQPPTEPAPDLDQRSWPQFVQQVQQQFNIAEQQLQTYLDAGIQSLQQNYPQVYRLLERSFPLLINIMQEMANAGIRFTSCLPDKPPSSRRLKARAEQDVCKKVLAAIGQSTPGGSQPDKTPPSTTPSSPSDQNESQDSKGNSGPPEADKNLGLAIGIPVSAFTAGLAAFVASADGAALLASAAASLGISTEVGSAAEAATSALGRTTSSLTQVTRQAVQRVVGRVSRLGHRVANPLLRQITSRALRSATERASEHIPLLSFSG